MDKFNVEEIVAGMQNHPCKNKTLDRENKLLETKHLEMKLSSAGIAASCDLTTLNKLSSFTSW